MLKSYYRKENKGKDTKMKDEVIFLTDKNRLIACLMKEIDHHSARQLRRSIDERLFIEKPACLVLDFSAVRFMDSSGIALILGRAEVARSANATLEVRGLSPVLMKLLRLSGVDRIENITVTR